MKNRYPDPFKVGDQFVFENKHGKVVLEAISESVPVSNHHFDFPPEHMITWDELEQVALITDQVRLQPICGRDLNSRCCGWLKHDTTSTAGMCKVVSLEYKAKSPAKDVIEMDLKMGRNRIII